MAKNKMTPVQQDIDRVNRASHFVSHVLIGFAFAHLLSWFNWIIVLAFLLIIVAIKEFLVDAIIYKHPMEAQITDSFEYFIGFAICVGYLYLLSIFPSSSSIF